MGARSSPELVLARRQIRYWGYDEPDLLPPEQVAEDPGYGSYESGQLEQAGVIATFRRLQVSPAEIKGSWRSSCFPKRGRRGSRRCRWFGQAVARPLAGARVLTGEQSQFDEPLESVGENI
jgi:hypothetical protein